ncbi:MAG TPA: dephospho-CoA kinase [Gemmatimonadaceae bacterium]|jgi:dephospho-CoA kinase|nr:dephospho-CoA kinase [Gemmatimonadaceae bacterium]
MLLVGLTGNIASGKSSVARMLAERGATIIDADVLAREAVEPGTPALAAIAERWGPQVLQADGRLDRDKLRAIAFGDPEQLEALNRIVHPDVERRRVAAVEAARVRGDRIVVCDIPLLFEKKMVHLFDMVVLVDAPRPMRMERVVQSRGLDQAEAMAIIAAQMPADLKRARADLLIRNTGSLEDLERRVDAAWATLDAAATAREGAAVP